jgi:hypothetical protein
MCETAMSDLSTEDTRVLAELRDTARTWEDFHAAQDRLAEVNAAAAAADSSYNAGRTNYDEKGGRTP